MHYTRIYILTCSHVSLLVALPLLVALRDMCSGAASEASVVPVHGVLGDTGGGGGGGLLELLVDSAGLLHVLSDLLL